MKKLLLVVLVLGLALAIGATSLILHHVPSATYAVDAIDSEAHWGTISGSLSYPSEGIPPMGVCAQAADGIDQYCTYRMLEGDQYLYGAGYELSVPPGTYVVFSHLVTDENEKFGYTDEEQAYYSKFVTCGLSFDCPSHEPIPVEVARNAHVQDVDPIDWYVL